MDCKMPSISASDPEERSFGRFAYRMRAQYRSGTLSKDHIEVLEDIAGWSWEIKTPIPITYETPKFYQSLFDNETDVETANRICDTVKMNKLSPIYMINLRDDPSPKKLVEFRKQYKKGTLSKVVEDILRTVPKSWSYFGNITEEDIFHDDKFDDYLCYSKIPDDIYFRCWNANNLAKEWHTQYLKKKLDIIDSKISGEIFNFEFEYFNNKFTNLLRDYFSGEQERKLFNSLPVIGFK